jgi:hypothetical protein
MLRLTNLSGRLCVIYLTFVLRAREKPGRFRFGIRLTILAKILVVCKVHFPLFPSLPSPNLIH